MADFATRIRVRLALLSAEDSSPRIMSPRFVPLFVAFVLNALTLPAAHCAAEPTSAPLTLVDWGTWPAARMERRGATVELGDQQWLVLKAATGTTAPEIALRAEGGRWALGSYAEVAIPVRNRGPRAVRVWLRVADEKTLGRPRETPRSGRSYEAVVPPGGRPVWLSVLLGGPEAVSYADKLISLRHAPSELVRRGAVLGDRVAQISLGAIALPPGEAIELGPIVARGTPAPLRGLSEGEAFPLFDLYGQYRHRSWPDKITAEADFAAKAAREADDLAANPRPADWDRFGGWSAGPLRTATGFFRVEKIDGQWWWVDPEGRLFWSHGIVRVGTRIRVGGIYHGSPILNREYLFTLPPRASEFGQFYGTEPASTRFYYTKYPNHAVYDFLEANLYRKYGADWPAKYGELAHRRLASWSLNTVANSSDPTIYRQHRTPYTAILYSAPMGADENRIAGSGGNWGKLPDPFDPGWRAAMDRTLRSELADVLDDPWCLGLFVDNELHWGDATYIAEATIASPASQSAKVAFRVELERKYGEIAKLNAAWRTNHADWAAWAETTTVPKRRTPALTADLEHFSREVTEAYFQGCRDAVKTAAPHHLYLGARFDGTNTFVLQAAARYCDVISMNPYYASVEDLALPPGVDRPILIGEFHFGALDRGPLGSALVPVADQAARAVAYTEYVLSALRNPRIIGTHWFQYFDQPSSGRFDSENYQTGFVDTCDTPYAETVAAARDLGRRMYQVRADHEAPDRQR